MAIFISLFAYSSHCSWFKEQTVPLFIWVDDSLGNDHASGIGAKTPTEELDQRGDNDEDFQVDWEDEEYEGANQNETRNINVNKLE